MRVDPSRRRRGPLQLRPRLSDILSNPFVRLRLALLFAFVLFMVGTIGYMAIEKYTFLNAIYMTVITLSTVGYDEVGALDNSGKVFTICLIVFGIGTAAWAFTTVIEVFVSEQTLRLLARKRMDRQVSLLQKHYIICGYGRIGQQIAQNYSMNGVNYVVIEQEESRLEMLRMGNVLHTEGDAADDEVLRRAGIAQAAALIAVTPTDAINTFIVLSARNLRPDLFIVARADSLRNEAKLYRAGASKVVSPHVLGGRWMAITAINPAVTDFIAAMTEADHTEYSLREFLVDGNSEIVGMTFVDARLRPKTGALVVAIRQGANAGRFIPNPPDDLPIVQGDVLIAIGSIPQLKRLARVANPRDPQSVIPVGIEV